MRVNRTTLFHGMYLIIEIWNQPTRKSHTNMYVNTLRNISITVIASYSLRMRHGGNTHTHTAGDRQAAWQKKLKNTYQHTYSTENARRDTLLKMSHEH